MAGEPTHSGKSVGKGAEGTGTGSASIGDSSSGTDAAVVEDNVSGLAGFGVCTDVAHGVDVDGIVSAIFGKLLT